MLKRFAFYILLCNLSVTVMAQTEREADLKAVFIYNFTKYIEWDEGNTTDDFVIGILGSSPVTNSLTEIANTNTVKNRKIVIRRFSKPEDIETCNILFIPQKLSFSLESILNKVDKGVLTVSEQPGYAKLGTAFNFVLINDKLKFEVNLKAIYSAGLRAGSQLLKLAIIVDD